MAGLPLTGLLRATQIAKALTVATVITLTAASTAMAQEASRESPQRVLEAIDEIFNTYSGNFFDDRTINAQIRLITGPGGLDSARWPEREIEYDANALGIAFENLLTLQSQQDPTLRVPDLPNPYTSSLLTMPGVELESNFIGSEFIFE